MQVSVRFKQQINIRNQIPQLFARRTIDDKRYLMGFAPQFVYQFSVTTQTNKYGQVYKTRGQMLELVYELNQRYIKLIGLKTITLTSLKEAEILQKVVKFENKQCKKIITRFFNINNLLTTKITQFRLKKQSGGRYSQFDCFLCSSWKSAIVFVCKNSLVIYSLAKDKVHEYLPFDQHFHWKNSEYIYDLRIDIYSYHRKLSLKANTIDEFLIFTYSLQRYLKMFKNPHNQYRFHSFAPVRPENNLQFFVDGKQYFQSLFNAFESAKSEIFICGWWVSPQFFLKRSKDGINVNNRLDKTLERAAKRNVKIYIIIYCQSSFLSNDSLHTQESLEKLHQNIRVLRHPQIFLPSFWSHHQKLVVIDQTKGFLGGLDICFGRFDCSQHRIDESNKNLYPGIQYNNCRKADFMNVRKIKKQNIPRNIARLPWHDVSLMVEGGCVKDLSTHFIQYWNYASYQVYYAQRYVLVSKGSNLITHKNITMVDKIKEKASEIFMSKIKSLISQKQEGTRGDIDKIESQKELVEANIYEDHKYQKQGTDYQLNPSSDLKIINQQKQSPYKIVVKEVRDDSEVNSNEQKDLQKEFEDIQNERIIQQQKQIQQRLSQIQKIQEQYEQEDQRSINNRIIVEDKQAIKSLIVEEKTIQRQVKQNQRRSKLIFLSNFGNKIVETRNLQEKEQLKEEIGVLQNYGLNQCKIQRQEQSFSCQILRSASQWSIGIKQNKHQKSIQDGYLHLISKASNFIYIENQFFISATHEKGVVKNKVMEALCQRIYKAIDRNENFRVMIIMPLVPGFAGQLDDSNASFPRVIMNWQYKTLARGQNSLIGRLLKKTKNPYQYVQIYGLRSHGVIENSPVTQIIYLHSKLMIIDDKYLICGSANINDRSLEGNRDSQLCIAVESISKTQKIFNKIQCGISSKIHDLRTKLWMQHFGCQLQQVVDPMKDQTWWNLHERAFNNTKIYRQLFGCYPDDNIKEIQQMKAFKKESNLLHYKQRSRQIKGFAVQFPLRFLEKENLTSFHPNQLST